MERLHSELERVGALTMTVKLFLFSNFGKMYNIRFCSVHPREATVFIQHMHAFTFA